MPLLSGSLLELLARVGGRPAEVPVAEMGAGASGRISNHRQIITLYVNNSPLCYPAHDQDVRNKATEAIFNGEFAKSLPGMLQQRTREKLKLIDAVHDLRDL
jgi:hypothetical protein